MDDSWLRCSSFDPTTLPPSAQPAAPAQPQVDHAALLAAAEGLLSSSEDSDASLSASSGSPRKPRSSHRAKDSKRSKHKKHKKSSHGSSRKRKRNEAERDVDKMRRIEQRLGVGTLGHRHPSSSGALVPFTLSSNLIPGSRQQPEAVLDTTGDKQNLVYRSLHAKDIPKYQRLDPLNLVRRPNWQLRQGEKDTTTAAADRYFRGRHVLQERSRTTKRIHLADLRPGAPAVGRAATNTSSRDSLAAQLWQPLQLLLPIKPSAADAASRATIAHKLSLPAPSYIPLVQEAGAQPAAGFGAGGGGPEGVAVEQQLDPSQLVQQVGESGEQVVLRVTRSWNVALREHPEREQLWLDYVTWQEEAARLLGTRRAADAAAVAERQISILKRALQHHPGSPRLLLALLRAAGASGVDAAEPGVLMERWSQVLDRNPGSWLLWREYLSVRCRQYSSFKVTAVQDAFSDAIADLHRHKLRLQRTLQQQQQQVGGMQSSSKSAVTAGQVVQAEVVLAQVVLGLLQLLLEAGYTEQAVARMQALLEYQCCAPPTPPGPGAAGLLRRWFKGFWDSGAPRLGQSKAGGWAAWCLGSPAGAVAAAGGGAVTAAAAGAGAAAAEEPDEPQPKAPPEGPGGGWSGWFEAAPGDTGDAGANELLPGPQQQERPAGDATHQQQPQDPHQEGDLEDASDQEEEKEEPAPEEEDADGEGGVGGELDEFELMVQLGIDLEDRLLEAERQGLPPAVCCRWAAQETQRSLDCWQPLPEDHPGVEAAAAAGELDPSCLVGFADVEGVLLGFDSAASRRQLLLGVLELLGVPLGAWGSSNIPTPWQQHHCGAPDQASYLPLLLQQRHVAAGVAAAGATWPAHLDPAGVAAAGISGATGTPQLQAAGVAALAAAGLVGLTGPVLRGLDDLILTANAPSLTALSGPLTASSAPGQGPGVGPGCGVGGVAGAGTWWSGSKARWRFVLQLLQGLLTQSTVSTWPELTHGYVLLSAAEPPAAAAGSGGWPDEGGGAAADSSSLLSQPSQTQQQQQQKWPSKQQLEAGRAAAKQLMAAQQQQLQQQQQAVATRQPAAAQKLLQLRAHLQQLLVADALATLEAAAGNLKAARKALTASLTAARKLVSSYFTGSAVTPDGGVAARAATGAAGAGGGARGGPPVVSAILAGAAAAAEAAAMGEQGGVMGQSAQEAEAVAAVAGSALMLALRLADLECQAAAAAAAGSSSSRPSTDSVTSCLQQACAALVEGVTGQPCLTSSQVAPTGPTSTGDSSSSAAGVSTEQLVAAQRAVQQYIPQLVQVGQGALDRNVATLVTAAAALELLAAAAQGREQQGARAAAALLHNVSSSIQPSVRASSMWCEQLTVWQCGVLVLAATDSFPWQGESATGSSNSSGGGQGRSRWQQVVGGVTPADTHPALSAALQVYPGNPKLLELLLVLSAASFSQAQTRLALQQLLEVVPSAAAWGVVLKAELLGGGLRGVVGRQQLKQLLEKAIGMPSWTARQKQRTREQLLQQQLQQAAAAAEAAGQQAVAAVAADGSSLTLFDCWHGCSAVPQLWRLYMYWQAAAGQQQQGVAVAGKVQDAARKVLLRALHACPAAKQLWVEGLGGAAGELAPAEAKGLMGAAEEREVLLRVDVMEVLLQQLEQEGL